MHGDERYLRIVQLVCSAVNSPVKALFAGLEIDPNLSPFQARSILAEALMDRPTVVIFSESDAVPSTHWYEMSLLMEHFSKSMPALPLCVVAFDCRRAIVQEPSFDFSSGRCTHLLLAESQVLEEQLLWRAYLHHRACWEAAGNPERAQKLGQQLEVTTIGDDVGVENVLAQFAADASAQMNVEEVARLVPMAFQRPDNARREAARTALQAVGALWRPPGMQRLEVTPLASRELLRRTHIPEELIPRLRHNLVCMPLGDVPFIVEGWGWWLKPSGPAECGF